MPAQSSHRGLRKKTLRGVARFGPPLAIALLAAGCAGMPENMAAPPLPKTVSVPPGHRHEITLKAQGSFNYECRPVNGMSGAYGWVLDAPDARLLHWSGLRIGRLYGGPTWEHRDGSKVTARLLASSPDEHGKLPIQLLQALTTTGKGEFSGVRYIQRLNAVGSEPRARCTAAEVGRTSRVPFTADFLFYK